MINRLFRIFLSKIYLVCKIEADRLLRIERKKKLEKDAIIDSSAIITDEAIITNLTGDKTNLIIGKKSLIKGEILVQHPPMGK